LISINTIKERKTSCTYLCWWRSNTGSCNVSLPFTIFKMKAHYQYIELYNTALCDFNAVSQPDSS